MRHRNTLASELRRPTNVTLASSLLAQARALKINVSQACEAGLAAEVKAVRAIKWLEENRVAMDEYNERIEREGMLLADLRLF